MPERTETPAADLVARVHAWVDTQGYAVEHRAASILAAKGFVSRQGMTYRDPIVEKVREIDVVARDRRGVNGAEFHLVVECKRSTHPWVTRTTAATILQKGGVAWLPVATDAVRELLQTHRRVLDAFPIARPVPFDVVEAKLGRNAPNPGSSSVPNAAYGALAQVVSAAAGLLLSAGQFPNPAVMHPIVVFDGDLFRASFEDGAVSRVEPIEWERIHWSGAPNLTTPVVVDVVTLPAFPPYVDALKSEIEELNYELRQAVPPRR
jgi:hypothetical protein